MKAYLHITGVAMVITFCGHAHYSASEEHEMCLLAFLEATVGDRDADMYFGGYGNFDRFSYNCGKKYKKNHPKVNLLLITPYIDRPIYKEDAYDGIIYPGIECKPARFAIIYRNRWMVENADYVIAYVNHTYGGAYTTYQYAVKKRKHIYNLGKLQK